MSLLRQGMQKKNVMLGCINEIFMRDSPATFDVHHHHAGTTFLSWRLFVITFKTAHTTPPATGTVLHITLLRCKVNLLRCVTFRINVGPRLFQKMVMELEGNIVLITLKATKENWLLPGEIDTEVVTLCWAKTGCFGTFQNAA
jgi:hypothetical protein